MPVSTAFCTNDQIRALFGGGLRHNSNDPLADDGNITQVAEEQADEIRQIFSDHGADEPYNQNAQVLASWLNAKGAAIDLANSFSTQINPNLYGFYKSLKLFQDLEFRLLNEGRLDILIVPCAYSLDSDGFTLLLPGDNCSVYRISGYCGGWDSTKPEDLPTSDSVEEWKTAITTISYGLGMNNGYLIPSNTVTLNRKQANIYTRLINEWTAAVVLQSRLYQDRSLVDIATYERTKSVKALIEEFLADKWYSTLAAEQFGSTACSCSGGSSGGGGGTVEVQAFTGVFDSNGRFDITGHDFNTLEGRSFGYIGRPNDGNSTLYLEINSSTSATLGNMGDGANANCPVYVNIF